MSLRNRTRAELEAAAALLDAAAEVASLVGEHPDCALSFSERNALGVLYRANDVWQEAQLAAPAPKRKPLRRKPKAGGAK